MSGTLQELLPRNRSVSSELEVASDENPGGFKAARGRSGAPTAASTRCPSIEKSAAGQVRLPEAPSSSKLLILEDDLVTPCQRPDWGAAGPPAAITNFSFSHIPDVPAPLLTSANIPIPPQPTHPMLRTRQTSDERDTSSVPAHEEFGLDSGEPVSGLAVDSNCGIIHATSQPPCHGLDSISSLAWSGREGAAGGSSSSYLGSLLPPSAALGQQVPAGVVSVPSQGLYRRSPKLLPSQPPVPMNKRSSLGSTSSSCGGHTNDTAPPALGGGLGLEEEDGSEAAARGFFAQQRGWRGTGSGSGSSRGGLLALSRNHTADVCESGPTGGAGGGWGRGGAYPSADELGGGASGGYSQRPKSNSFVLLSSLASSAGASPAIPPPLPPPASVSIPGRSSGGPGPAGGALMYNAERRFSNRGGGPNPLPPPPAPAGSTGGSSTASLTKKIQYHKTKLCPWHRDGKCYMGNTCNYAHHQEELKPKPDLSKTKLCPDYVKHKRCDRPGCRFAHDFVELRATPTFFKTRLCKYWQRGGCPAGDSCRHAHGREDLRAEVEPSVLPPKPPGAFAEEAAAAPPAAAAAAAAASFPSTTATTPLLAQRVGDKSGGDFVGAVPPPPLPFGGLMKSGTEAPAPPPAPAAAQPLSAGYTRPKTDPRFLEAAATLVGTQAAAPRKAPAAEAPAAATADATIESVAAILQSIVSDEVSRAIGAAAAGATPPEAGKVPTSIRWLKPEEEGRNSAVAAAAEAVMDTEELAAGETAPAAAEAAAAVPEAKTSPVMPGIESRSSGRTPPSRTPDIEWGSESELLPRCVLQGLQSPSSAWANAGGAPSPTNLLLQELMTMSPSVVAVAAQFLEMSGQTGKPGSPTAALLRAVLESTVDPKDDAAALPAKRTAPSEEEAPAAGGGS